MLILSLRADESIMVGDNVEIVVLSWRANQVRVGVKAPKEIAVHRKKIYDAIQAEKNLATTHERAGCDSIGDPL
jgi:carbon storage regulator